MEFGRSDDSAFYQEQRRQRALEAAHRQQRQHADPKSKTRYQSAQPSSSEDYLSSQSKGKNEFFGVQIKREFGLWQFLVIPVISTATVTVGAYLNAQLAYMLEDKRMFHMPLDQIGQLTSDLTVYSLPFSMATTFFISYIFEIIGRKLTIFFSFLLTALMFLLLPYTAPDYRLLVAARCAIGVTMAAPIAHPLIPDYVKRSSRGAAIAVAGVGVVFGEVFSMGILFNLTKSLNYFDAFMVASLVVTAFAVFFLYAVRDPDLEVIRNASESRHSVMMRRRTGQVGLMEDVEGVQVQQARSEDMAGEMRGGD